MIVASNTVHVANGSVVRNWAISYMTISKRNIMYILWHHKRHASSYSHLARWILEENDRFIAVMFEIRYAWVCAWSGRHIYCNISTHVQLTAYACTYSSNNILPLTNEQEWFVIIINNNFDEDETVIAISVFALILFFSQNASHLMWLLLHEIGSPLQRTMGTHRCIVPISFRRSWVFRILATFVTYSGIFQWWTTMRFCTK